MYARAVGGESLGGMPRVNLPTLKKTALPNNCFLPKNPASCPKTQVSPERFLEAHRRHTVKKKKKN